METVVKMTGMFKSMTNMFVKRTVWKPYNENIQYNREWGNSVDINGRVFGYGTYNPIFLGCGGWLLFC